MENSSSNGRNLLLITCLSSEASNNSFSFLQEFPDTAGRAGLYCGKHKQVVKLI